MNLDWQLKEVLRRHDPPEGFAERVLARRGAEGLSPPIGRLKPGAPRWHRALAAAVLVIAIIGGFGIHARNELLTAMRIASHQVARAQQEVNRR